MFLKEYRCLKCGSVEEIEVTEDLESMIEAAMVELECDCGGKLEKVMGKFVVLNKKKGRWNE